MIVVCGQFIHANNVCYIEESSCKFRVTVLPVSSCPSNHVNDQPDVIEVTTSIFRYWQIMFNILARFINCASGYIYNFCYSCADIN